MVRKIKNIYHLFVAIISLFRFRFPSNKLIVIGVTGTDGKTTTTTLVHEILKKAKIKSSVITSVHAEIAGNIYNTGFHVTTPSPYYIQKYLREALDHGDTHVVLEVTSHALSQYRVFGVRFAVGILTNVTHEHLDWHGTYEHYLKTKLTLLQQAKISIVNIDEANVFKIAMRVLKRKRVISYGIRRNADVTPSTFPFQTKLPGVYNRYNCLSAAACAEGLGIPRAITQVAISQFSGLVGRMEVIQQKPFRVIIDFAHTPNALEQVLKTVKESTVNNLIHVFGSAGERDKSKRPIMGKMSAKYSDISILTEEDYRSENVEDIMDQIASGISDQSNLLRYSDRNTAIVTAIKLAKPGDTIIITGKGHELSLCRGKLEYPWSDQEAVKKSLKA